MDTTQHDNDGARTVSAQQATGPRLDATRPLEAGHRTQKAASGPPYVLHFGRYAGHRLDEVPADYVKYLADRRETKFAGERALLNALDEYHGRHSSPRQEIQPEVPHIHVPRQPLERADELNASRRNVTFREARGVDQPMQADRDPEQRTHGVQNVDTRKANQQRTTLIQPFLDDLKIPENGRVRREDGHMDDKKEAQAEFARPETKPALATSGISVEKQETATRLENILALHNKTTSRKKRNYQVLLWLAGVEEWRVGGGERGDLDFQHHGEDTPVQPRFRGSLMSQMARVGVGEADELGTGQLKSVGIRGPQALDICRADGPANMVHRGAKATPSFARVEDEIAYNPWTKAKAIEKTHSKVAIAPRFPVEKSAFTFPEHDKAPQWPGPKTPKKTLRHTGPGQRHLSVSGTTASSNMGAVNQVTTMSKSKLPVKAGGGSLTEAGRGHGG